MRVRQQMDSVYECIAGRRGFATLAAGTRMMKLVKMWRSVAVDACEQEYAGMDRQTGIFGKK